MPILKLIFENQKIRLFILGGLCMSFGGAISGVALPLFILHVSRAPWLIGLVFGAREIPSTLLAPVLGSQVDRIGAFRSTLIGLSLSTFAITLVPFMSSMPVLIVCCAFILGVGWTLLFPTVSMYLPSLVEGEKLDVANSAFRTMSIIGSMAGTGVGGELLTAGLYNWAFWIDALTYIIALGTIVVIGNVHKNNSAGSPAGDSMGVRALGVVWKMLRSDAALAKMLMIDAAVYFSLGATGVLLPVYISHKFHDAWLFSLALVTEETGELLGGFCAPYIHRKIPAERLPALYAWMGLVMSLSYIGIGLWVSVLWLLVLTLLASFVLGILYVIYGTYMQTAIPLNIMGRFQSFAAAMGSVFQGSGNILSGGMSVVSVTMGYGVIGGVSGAISLGALLFRRRS